MKIVGLGFFWLCENIALKNPKITAPTRLKTIRQPIKDMRNQLCLRFRGTFSD